jgi:hypothetical protein
MVECVWVEDEERAALLALHHALMEPMTMLEEMLHAALRPEDGEGHRLAAALMVRLATAYLRLGAAIEEGPSDLHTPGEGVG